MMGMDQKASSQALGHEGTAQFVREMFGKDLQEGSTKNALYRSMVRARISETILKAYPRLQHHLQSNDSGMKMLDWVDLYLDERGVQTRFFREVGIEFGDFVESKISSRWCVECIQVERLLWNLKFSEEHVVVGHFDLTEQPILNPTLHVLALGWDFLGAIPEQERIHRLFLFRDAKHTIHKSELSSMAASWFDRVRSNQETGVASMKVVLESFGALNETSIHRLSKEIEHLIHSQFVVGSAPLARQGA